MNLQFLGRGLAITIISSVLAVSQVHAQLMGELFQMAGGMETVKKLATSLLQSSASDPRLAGSMGKMNVGTASPKLANQMCSLLGGGCKAPITDKQMATGASKLDASQTKALVEHFSSIAGELIKNPLVKEGVIKAVGPKLGGIIGALL